MSTKKMRDLKGMPVLTLEEGEEVGKVRDLLLDPGEVRVVAFLLDRRTAAKELQVVATANLHSVGKAAITVENRGSLVPISRIPRFQELARGKSPLHGKAVITEGGVRLGNISDVVVDLETFHVEALLLGSFPGRMRSIPAAQVRTIGPDAVVVREGPVEAAPLPAPAPIAGPGPAEILPGPPPPFPAAGTEPGPVEALVGGEVPPTASETAGSGADLFALPSIPGPGEAIPPAAEPIAPTPGIDAALPSDTPVPTGPGPAEPLPPAEAGQPERENPWQRWVRRLRRREQETER